MHKCTLCLLWYYLEWPRYGNNQQSVSIDRRMDKEEVVPHIYNGILFSHKREGNPAIYDNVDEP